VTILVPRGAEASAVRRAGTQVRIVATAAGAASSHDVGALDPREDVVVTGLCGALGTLAAGTVVTYRSVRDGNDAAAAFACDATLTAALRAALPETVVVDACTAARVVTTRAERAALASRCAAEVVDMEGVHLARALQARGIRFAMVRVVSDDASRDLPALGEAIGADGSVNALRVAAAFVRRPRAAFAFVRDVRRALTTLRATVRTISAA
jgi:nucleoside phosphorylase